MKNKKYALVLSGGGFKGAYQVGAMRYIQQSWERITGGESPMHFDIVAGVSVGALNGVLIASDKCDELQDIWSQVKEKGGGEIYKSDYITSDGKVQLNIEQLRKSLLPGFKVNAGLIMSAVWNSVRNNFDKKIPGLVDTILREAGKHFDKNLSDFKALADNSPLKQKLQQYVNLKDINDDTVYICGLVSIDNGVYYSLSSRDFNNNQDFVHAILASSAMPVIWAPVSAINTGSFGKITNGVDGGIRNISPLGDVVRYINNDHDDAEYEVIIINCNSGYITPLRQPWNIGDIALRTLTEITLAEIFNNDVAEFLKTNGLVRQAAEEHVVLRRKGIALKAFGFKLIQPEANELGDTLDSSEALIAKRERLGFEHAQRAFN